MSNVTLKYFVGCHIGSELKMHLNHSIKWKHANILINESTQHLQSVHYQGKDYIGSFLTGDKFTIEELKAYENKIQSLLGDYCPKYEIKNLQTLVFPQVFVA